MLTIYRRHRKSCKHRAKGRKYRHCQCPIWVDGWLNGKEIRGSLRLRDWQRAQEMVREWEAEGQRVSPPERKSLADSWREFLADVDARKLHESTNRKYKVLKRQMEEYAKRWASLSLTSLICQRWANFVPNGRTDNVRALRSSNGFGRSLASHRNESG